MVQDGSVVENTAKSQHSTTRIEEILRSEHKNVISKRRVLLKQTTTNTAADLEEKASQTVADAGKTELTIVAAASATDAGYLEKKLILVYKTAAGVVKTAVAELNDSDATTEVPFDPAISDFYEAVSLTSEVAPSAGHTFGIGPTGNLTYGVIQATATAAAEADLYGVGSICAKEATNQATDKVKVLRITYINNLGQLESGLARMDNSDTTTAVRFLKADGKTVNNFYRLRTLDFEVNAAANVYVLDKAASDKFAVIKSGNFQSLHSKFYVKSGAYLVPIIHRVATTQAAGSLVRFAYPVTPGGIDLSFDLIVAPTSINNYVLPFGVKDGNFNVQILAANAGDQGDVSIDLEILEVEEYGFV